MRLSLTKTGKMIETRNLIHGLRAAALNRKSCRFAHQVTFHFTGINNLWALAVSAPGRREFSSINGRLVRDSCLPFARQVFDCRLVPVSHPAEKEGVRTEDSQRAGWCWVVQDDRLKGRVEFPKTYQAVNDKVGERSQHRCEPRTTAYLFRDDDQT